MKKNSIGKWIVLVGLIVLAGGLILNGLDIIPYSVFRIIDLVGVFIEVAALFLIWGTNEF